MKNTQRLGTLLVAVGLAWACSSGSRGPSSSGAGGDAAEAGAGGRPDDAEGGADPGGRASGGAEASLGGVSASGAGGDGGAAAPTLDLFADGEVYEFRISLSDEAMSALSADPLTYQPGSLEFRGEKWSNVGVRLKGRASAQGFDQKPAFKLKMNELVAGQRLAGRKRLTLNNMVQDPTMMRERLGYAYLRSLGLPAPRCNHARVFVNDVYYGLYLNLETLDEDFIRRAFPGAGVGNLYDITNDEYFIDFDRSWEPPAQESKFALETNEATGDTSDLTALIDAVYASSAAEFVEATEAELDLDEVLLLGAAQAVIADWDGYFGARNNYKAYHELERDRFVILPWGIDQTFWPEYVDYAIDHSGSRRPRSIVYERCAAAEPCRDRYLAKVAEANDGFVRLKLATLLNGWLVQTQGDIDADERQPYSPDEHERAITELRAFLKDRPARVRAQLAP